MKIIRRFLAGLAVEAWLDEDEMDESELKERK